jgi:hypothetical protein
MDVRKLTSKASKMFLDLQKEHEISEASMLLAGYVGGRVAREGGSEKDLTSWLQANYGTVFVKLSPSFDCGHNLRDLLKFALKTFLKVKSSL